MKLFGRGFGALGLFLAAVLLAGCETNERYYPIDPGSGATTGGGGSGKSGPTRQAHYLLRVGDDLVVTILDTPNVVPPIQDTIRDDGTITLINSQKFEAAGKTITELQAEIHKRYVPDYYRTLTASINLANRFYYVNGEVHSPGRIAYAGPIKVVEAVNTAGGPTDYANMKKVKVTRDNNEQISVNIIKAQKDPKLNFEIFPGDRIDVPKALW
jgi:protein involved in polysaccharide export with SLBB domain